MKKVIRIGIPALIVLVYFACRKPYSPTVTSTNYNYLVVEGNITSGDSTIIKLSRTQPVGSKDKPTPELNANVAVLGTKQTYSLTEAGNGFYKMGPVNLDPAMTYCIYIETKDGQRFQSDFVQMKITPPIDTFYYKIIDTALQFYVGTHDINNATHYYRWDYQETWSYVANERKNFDVKNGVISPFNRDSLFNCYKSAPSKSVFIASTNQLKQDIVTQQPLGVVGPGSQKISHIYSILLSQYALTGAGEAYFAELKKNSEQLGSIFDAQPTTTLGNIHCINNPAELVIGFMSASTITRKRIIINVNDFGLSSFRLAIQSYFGPPANEECKLDTLARSPANFATISNQFFFNGFYTPVDIVVVVRGDVFDTVGVSYAQRTCVDCRLRGGTIVKPSFFP